MLSGMFLGRRQGEDRQVVVGREQGGVILVEQLDAQKESQCQESSGVSPDKRSSWKMLRNCDGCVTGKGSPPLNKAILICRASKRKMNRIIVTD